jgi:hypothetical protein
MRCCVVGAPTRPVNALPHRRRLHPEYLRDISRRHLLEVAQYERVTIHVRQPRECRPGLFDQDLSIGPFIPAGSVAMSNLRVGVVRC